MVQLKACRAHVWRRKRLMPAPKLVQVREQGTFTAMKVTAIRGFPGGRDWREGLP